MYLAPATKIDGRVLVRGRSERHYLLVSREVLPALLEVGVTQQEIDAMLIENPQRIFGG